MRYPRKARGVRFDRDEGQVLLSIVFGMGTVLAAILAVGVDMTNLFFHREAAQGAADAACQAAAMDLLVNELEGTSLGGFTAGTSFDCAKTTSAAPCKYAALNGYSSPGLTASAKSNDVSVSFPSSVPGVTAPPAYGTGGLMFYFSGTAGHIGSINISSTGTQTLDPFYTAGGGPANNPSVTCPGGKAPDPALPTTVGGNVLMGMCSGTYGDPLGYTRGMLMFQDRSDSGTSAWNQPNLSGSGGLLLAGNLYFHNCVGTPCTGYNQLVTISGASGSTTDVVGEIVADQLLLTGNGSINMNLSPYGSFKLLKAALLQ